jgi:hypothetical protein
LLPLISKDFHKRQVPFSRIANPGMAISITQSSQTKFVSQFLIDSASLAQPVISERYFSRKLEQPHARIFFPQKIERTHAYKSTCWACTPCKAPALFVTSFQNLPFWCSRNIDSFPAKEHVS